MLGSLVSTSQKGLRCELQNLLAPPKFCQQFRLEHHKYPVLFPLGCIAYILGVYRLDVLS